MQANIRTYPQFCFSLPSLAPTCLADIKRHYLTYAPIYNFLALFLLTFFLCFLPFDVWADDSFKKVDPPDILNGVILIFNETCRQWAQGLRTIARSLFISLLGITAVWRFSQLLLRWTK